MLRRSSGSSAEGEGDSWKSTFDVPRVIDELGARPKPGDSISKKEPAASAQLSSAYAPSQNISHELDRRKSLDKRPSIARSRLTTNTNYKLPELRDGQLDKDLSAEASAIRVPAKTVIAGDKMADFRTNERRARLRSPWSCSLLTLFTTALAAITLAAILHSFSTRQLDSKGCRMSYMRPSFAKLTDFDTEHTRFASKYSVYLYREGMVDEDTKVCVDPSKHGGPEF